MRGFPLTQGWSDSILKKNRPGVRVGVRESKFGPNDKKQEKIFSSGYNS